jgi:3',5'-cyclic AMP phosphodiesterase CpdA
LLIAQLTDLHVVPENQLLHGLVDTNRLFEAAVQRLNTLAPRPDAVLLTGDLVEQGTPECYAALRARLERLAVTYYVIPGNHDSRAPLRQAFIDQAYLPRDGFVQYVIETHAVRLIALDTVLERREEGELCQHRLTWLRETLNADRARPTLVFMHHPPFETGIWWMDGCGLSGADELASLLDQHPQVKLVVCGHQHRAITSSIGRAIVSVAPSTCYQVHLDLTPEAPAHVILEPPALQLHLWTGTSFVTHTALVDPGNPLDISKSMDWPALVEELRERRARLWPRLG